MRDILIGVAGNQVLGGAAIVITFGTALYALISFFRRGFGFLGEKHQKYSNRFRDYQTRIDTAAAFASDDPAYLSALFWLKASRVVSIALIAALCIIVHNLFKDGMFSFIGVAISLAAANTFSILACCLAFVALFTLYEINRIARAAVDNKDKVYFPDRFGQ